MRAYTFRTVLVTEVFGFPWRWRTESGVLQLFNWIGNYCLEINVRERAGMLPYLKWFKFIYSKERGFGTCFLHCTRTDMTVRSLGTQMQFVRDTELVFVLWSSSSLFSVRIFPFLYYPSQLVFCFHSLPFRVVWCQVSWLTYLSACHNFLRGSVFFSYLPSRKVEQVECRAIIVVGAFLQEACFAFPSWKRRLFNSGRLESIRHSIRTFWATL